MIRLNETNPRLDRRNTFVDESHSGHVANYPVHDLVVPARRRRETEGLPSLPFLVVRDDRLSIPPRDRVRLFIRILASGRSFAVGVR